MNRLSIAAMLLGFYLAGSNSVLAQNQASTDTQTQTQTANASVEAAMQALDDFMTAFNARDPEAWAASLNYPHVRFASGTVTVWESHEEFAQTTAFQRLPATGWHHSAWLSREVALASPGKVHVNTVFQRFNADNEVIGTYQSLYIVTEKDGHWGTQARSSLAP